MSNENNKKNLKIVSGNIADLNLSPVSEHINVSKHKNKTNPNNIVIPREKNKK